MLSVCVCVCVCPSVFLPFKLLGLLADCHETWYERYTVGDHPQVHVFFLYSWSQQPDECVNLWGGSDTGAAEFKILKLCMVIGLRRIWSFYWSNFFYRVWNNMAPFGNCCFALSLVTISAVALKLDTNLKCSADMEIDRKYCITTYVMWCL
jgi:hypothetical protein